MNSRILKEYAKYSFEDLKARMDLDDDKLLDIIKTLSYMNILKKKAGSKGGLELDELQDFESVELPDEKEDYYYFRFVGIIIIENIYLIIYPKYLPVEKIAGDKEFKLFKQIINVISKYNHRVDYNKSISISDGENFNLLSLALFMINSYYEHGLYLAENEVVENNGDGEILWDRTINEKMAFFYKNTPVYFDLYTSNTVNDQDNYFMRLHACVLTEACNRLADILTILDIYPINLSNEKLENFGSEDYIVYRINQELSRQYVSYKIDVLNNIKSYILNKNNRLTTNNIAYVGTNSFYNVWEDVCAVVMDDCLEKEIGELGYRFRGEEKIKLKDLIEKPQWIHAGSGNSHDASKSLEPDIISIKDNEVSIYDAKYYNIYLDDKKVSNQPGVESITKQYLYQLAYKEFLSENQLKVVRNAFLFPTADDTESSIGIAKMNMLSSIEDKLNDIEAILLPCSKLFDKYLSK